MDSVQEKEFQERETNRSQSNRITALHMAIEITKVGSVEDTIDEAEKILKFIEAK